MTQKELDERVTIETGNGLYSMTYRQILADLSYLGIEMQHTGEYWKAIRYTDEGQYDVIWQDSASEDAYDEKTAIPYVYNMIWTS